MNIIGLIMLVMNIIGLILLVMNIIGLILLVLAMICFILDSIGAVTRVKLEPLGLALLVCGLLVSGWAGIPR